MSKFKKATKEQSKLRMAIFGPSGAGKTFTALSIAKGMGGNIALIDTEYGSASKYGNRFDFDTVSLVNPTIDRCIEMINEAKGYNVLIIDSLSHAWQELLQEVDKLAVTKYGRNTFSAWSEGTPKQKKLIKALLSFEGHLIVTMRSKTEWTTQTDEKGKSKPVRVGLAPEQGKGIEYEFDLLLELSVEHIGSVLKDRTGKYQDSIIEKPGEAFGAELMQWLSTGEVAAAQQPLEPDRVAAFQTRLQTAGYETDRQLLLVNAILKTELSDLCEITEAEAAKVWNTIKGGDYVLAF
jgi:hypothetical protein